MKIPVIFLAFANDKVDNARYLRNLPLELDGIRKAIKPAEKANLCEVVERANATIENILDTFQDERYRDRIAIFHYGGHADGYQLLLEQLDGSHAVAQGGGLVSFFSKQEGLKLVFFNGCSTHQQSVELMQAGIPAVIGTSNAINDDIATDLSLRFYKGIAQGMTLERAWNSAIDEVKIKKGEANTRGLYRKQAAEKMEDERFPWELLIREGAEIIKEFNLPSEVNNPLFGLPEIPQEDLPELPYQFLMRYDRSHAEVFFGRARYIRDLYNRIIDKNSTSIITICGQAGVGKSSLFDAGLVPRLEQSHVVKYIRRSQDKGLLGTLEDVLGITKTEAEIQEDIAEAREASFSFEQKPIETLSLDAFPISSYSVASENPPIITTTPPETFEGQPVVNTNLESRGEPSGINQQQTTNNQQSTTNNVLIEQLRNLAAVADPSVQNSIFKLIEDLQNNRNQSNQNQIVSNNNQLPTQCESKVLERWLQIEQESGKPLVIILDQVEEVYTRAMANLADLTNEEARVNIGEHEIQTFLTELKKVFDNPNKALQPKGKLLLGFRKEFQPDFEEWFKYFQIPQNKVFIDILKRDEVIEIVQGLTMAERLRRNYRVSVETGLAEIIADDLLEDKDSAVAPILQLILTNLWKSCENDESRIFTTQKYQDFRREGLLMRDFVDDQLKTIREWNAELEQSGLVLDILMQHTTRFGTAGTKTLDEMIELYKYIKSPMISILEKAKEMYLLVDLGQRTGLAHDSIAPVIIEKYTESMYPGQRAMRLLKSKMPNFDPENPKKKDNSVLDERELGVVMAGRNGMVMWDKDTTGKMIKESERRRTVNKRKRRWRRIGFAASIVTIILFAIYSQRQKMLAQIEQTRAEASQLITLAVQNTDLAMSLRLAERADSLATSVGDNTMTDKLIEIVATNSFYTYQWEDYLTSEKICVDDDGEKFLFLKPNNNTNSELTNELVLKNWNDEELWKIETNAGTQFDLSPDGKKILAYDYDYVLRIWDLNGKQLLSVSEATSGTNTTINAAAFLPNGIGFYVIYDNSKVIFYDFKGRESFTYPVKYPSESLYKVLISKDMEYIALHIGITLPSLKVLYELRILDFKTKELLSKQTQAEYISQMTFAPNGEQLLWASDTTINLINLKGEVLSKWKLSEEQKVKTLCFSSDGKHIWTANENQTVRMYETVQVINNYQSLAQNRILPVRVFENDSYIDDIKILRNNQWLVTANQEYGIKFWYLANNYKILYGGINEYPFTSTEVSFAPDGKTFYTKSEGGVMLTSWQMQADSSSFVSEETNLSDGEKAFVSAKTNGKYILRVFDEIQVLDMESRILAKIPKPSNYYPEVFFLSDDGNLIITSSNYDTVTQVFDKEGKSLAIIKDFGNIIALSPNNQYLLMVNTLDDALEASITPKLWEIKSGKLILSLKGHKKLITSACFSPDGKHIVTGSEDKTAKIWNMQGQTVATLRGHSKEVHAVAFSPTNNYVLTGSEDYTARLWDLSGKMLNIYTAHKIKNLAFSPNGMQFISSGWCEYDQKDLFSIAMNKKTLKIEDNYKKSNLMNKEKHTVASIILWDINEDQNAWLKENYTANFSIIDYLEAGASISPQALLDLNTTYELNKAGSYFLESETPISGVSNEKRLRYAEKLFEKSLEVERTQRGVIGITNVTEQQTEPTNLDFWDKIVDFFTLKKRNWGKFDVDEMLNTQDVDELNSYVEYIEANKLSKANNRVDSLKYWQGMKKIAKKSLSIRQTPYALDAFNSANYALGDTKENAKMVFNNSLKDMREFAQFFSNKNEFKKESLEQAIKVFEHMFKYLKPTSDDYENAAAIYEQLASLQLTEKKIIEAEMSVKRGLELDKTNKQLIFKQIIILLATNRNEEARQMYQKQSTNTIFDAGELRENILNSIDFWSTKGYTIDRKKTTVWLGGY